MDRPYIFRRACLAGPVIVFLASCAAHDDPYLRAENAATDEPTPGASAGTEPAGEPGATQGAEASGVGAGAGALVPDDRSAADSPAPVDLPSGGAANDNDDDDDGADEVSSPPAGPDEPSSGITDDTPGLIRGPTPTLESATARGPFDVDTLSSGLRDGPEYGSQTLHFPTDAEPPFAGVVVVPGFLSPESSIQAWGPFLASHGIVTLTIGTNSPSDQPDARADALLDAVETLRAENARTSSPIEGRLDLTRFAVMGWSMGGGGTLIAANANPELRAAITLAAWSPGASFGADEVATLLLAGSADTLAGGQSQGFFSSIPESTPKMLFEVDGGSHSVANDPNGAGGEVGRFGLSWLKVFLEGDQRYRQLLLQAPTRQSDFQSNL